MTTKVITINNVNYNLVDNLNDVNPDEVYDPCKGCAFYTDEEACATACQIMSCGYSVFKEIQSDKPAVTPIANQAGSTFVYDKHYQTLILSRDNREVQRMQVQPHELQALLQFLSDVKLSDLIVDSSRNNN